MNVEDRLQRIADDISALPEEKTMQIAAVAVLSLYKKLASEEVKVSLNFPNGKRFGVVIHAMTDDEVQDEEQNDE